MLFSSLAFLYGFLPVTLLLYFLVPKQGKNLVLLLASLFFYFWGEPRYVLLMVGVILLAYLGGLLLQRLSAPAARKTTLIVLIVLHLGVLGLFKYADFFLSSFAAVTGLAIPLLKIALPIGISFYIFQSLSYLIDVYRGVVAAQKNPLDLATYIAMFPQLIAGPIVRYSDIERQLKVRTHSLERAALGLRRFVLGLAKKVLLANQLGALCATFAASNDKSVLFYWLYAIAFTLQIYFDFSGYSDMAIGLGKLFGFDFPENFRYPYIAKSITDFWRRWHISLGTWFRDYVYIPLGGNRVGKARHLFNIFVVWMLTGLWHGASWNFVIWGVFFAILLCIEKLFARQFFEKSKVIGHVYVLLAVILSFVIFNASDLSDAFATIGGMFGVGTSAFASAEVWYYLRSYGVVLAVAAVGATPLVWNLTARIQKLRVGGGVLAVLEPVALCALLLLCTAYLVDGSFNPFLYFRF